MDSKILLDQKLHHYVEMEIETNDKMIGRRRKKISLVECMSVAIRTRLAVYHM